MKMSIFFKSLRSMKRSGSKSRTSPATRAGRAEASKRVIGPMPERPATRLSQFASMPMPSGVTRPRPVTTTRRRVPFGAFKARNASAARAGVKVASHVRPVIAGSRDERPAAVRHPRLRRAAARGRLPLAARDGRLRPRAAPARHRHRYALRLHPANRLRRDRLRPGPAGHARRSPEDARRVPRRAVLLHLRGSLAGEARGLLRRGDDAVHAMIQAHPETIAWATSAADIRANAEHERISALFGVEGGHALLPGGETEMLEHLRTFYARGARYLTLTWSIASPLGGSSGDDSDGQGLTDVGRRIIDEMERLGMMVDVSHGSDPLFWDVVRYARKPVIASHSSARELANVPRNMSDAMLRAVARNGGAVCVNYGCAFLDQDFYAREQAVWARVRGLGPPPRELWRTVREETARLPPVPLARLVDHIDHVAKVAGIDHVCLGSDL